MKITLDVEELVRQNRVTAEEAQRLKSLADPHRGVRGLWWVIVPALLGLVIGELIGGLMALGRPIDRLEGREKEVLDGLLQGGVTGLIVGGFLGVVIWVFFPYIGPAAAATVTPAEEHPVPEHGAGKCPACGVAISDQNERCPSCSITLR